MKDRFDLENEINELHIYADQINLVSESIINPIEDIDKDTIVNALSGLSALLNMKTNKLFDTFCEIFKLDQYKETA
jgi:hypothetical protein